MEPKRLHHSSVANLHENLGVGTPLHPLITIINMADLSCSQEAVGTKVTSELYCIGMKDEGCGLEYGRNQYDFDGGTLMFLAPRQVLTLTRVHEVNEVDGWLLYFHPDLIRGTFLAEKIEGYSFFSYDVYEALHLSEQEENTINQCVEMIRTELRERIDHHSKAVVVSTIELLLNHCVRFYDRQFITRSPKNQDTVSKVESLLKDYFATGMVNEYGLPTIQYLAEQCNVSTYYLSDLLKKETGRTAKDHINDFIIDKAKNLLLANNDSINEIAYSLGFNYPHYFSRLFKAKTGVSPVEYRKN